MHWQKKETNNTVPTEIGEFFYCVMKKMHMESLEVRLLIKSNVRIYAQQRYSSFINTPHIALNLKTHF